MSDPLLECGVLLPIEAIHSVIIEEGLGQAVEVEILSEQIEDEALRSLWSQAKEALMAVASYLEEKLGSGHIWPDDSEDGEPFTAEEDIPDPDELFAQHLMDVDTSRSHDG